MSKKYRPVFKTQGGKFFLTDWIIDQFPQDYEKFSYIEPCAGGASVLLNKKASLGMEVLNDLDLGIVQIFRSLRDEPKILINKLRKIKVTELTFKRAKNKKSHKDYLDHAINEFVLRRMSRGGLKSAFNPEEEKTWESTIQLLPKVAQRIVKTHIFNKPAIEIIKAFDDTDFLCFCNPPNPTEDLPFSMTTSEHLELSEALHSYKGKVVISGHSSKLYKRLYDDWTCIKKKYPNHRMEILWRNY